MDIIPTQVKNEYATLINGVPVVITTKGDDPITALRALGVIK